MRVYTIHHKLLFIFSQSEPKFELAEPLSLTRLMPPGVDIDGKSDSPIHNLKYLNLVNQYECLFYKVTYSGVDVLPQLLFLHKGTC